MQLVFDRRIIKSALGVFRTRVIADGVNLSLYINYKKPVLKQYFKENRALRTETIINNPGDFGLRKDISNLPYLQKIEPDINRGLLDVQRVSHNCHLSQQSIERIVQPTLNSNGQRAPGLRFGQLPTMALLAALTSFVHPAFGFRHPDLRPYLADLPASSFSASQMSYDLRRLRLKGILWRVPKWHRYLLTPYGCKVALFFTRLNARVFRPGFAALDPEVLIPIPLTEALNKVEQEIENLTGQAHLLPTLI